MASRKPTGARSETVQCEHCGEYYAVTYKRCPFCDGRGRRSRNDEVGQDADLFADEYEEGDYENLPPTRSGGKRLVTNKRGGGYGRAPSPLKIIGTVLSLALIIAAIWIVVTIIRPFIIRGQTVSPGDVTPLPTVSVSPTPTPVLPSPTPSQSASPLPSDTTPPTVSPTVSPEPSALIPSTQTADSFTLSGNGDFTLYDSNKTYRFTVTFSPADTTGVITWESDRPDIISVDDSGLVTALKSGTATVTATMAGGYTQTCIVRSSISGGSSGSSGNTGSSGEGSSSSSGLTISRTDFTLSFAGDSWKLKVSGTSSAPTWSVRDSSIATVAEDGTVTAVSPGRTTVTATVDGQSLECIVRCSW